MATITTIAEACGVTKMTVSRVLSGKGSTSPATRQQVLEAARRLGYEPNMQARALATGHSDVIGLLVGVLYPGVHAQTAELLQEQLNLAGYDVPLYGFGTWYRLDTEKQAATVRGLRLRRPRAIVCHTSGLQPPALEELRIFQAAGGIVVCYGNPVDLACDQAVIGYENSTYQSTKHLLKLGHRRIGLLGSWIKNQPTVEPRVRGFLRAMDEAGIALNYDHLFDGPAYEEGGAWLAQQILAMPRTKRPTAMVVLHDASAGVFMNEMARAGVIVPRDMSVVGHEDIPAARYWSPPLTTLHHPVESITKSVTSMLLSRLGGETCPPVRTVNEGKLIVRESSAAPPRTRAR